MVIKIKSKVLGELYYFYVKIEKDNFNCQISLHFKTNPTFKGKISNDYKHVVFDEPITLSGYKANYLNAEKKTINKIKIPKDRIFDVKEYIK